METKTGIPGVPFTNDELQDRLKLAFKMFKHYPSHETALDLKQATGDYYSKHVNGNPFVGC
ncbi:hypothetical protein LCGC14_0857190 [marine sediment metagenome]|uniref:Uncharacterized protein n=1 Tax=marine sediment metagenome TaxID=412755 RepID=A0A0F9SFI0_9ZZZZ